MALPGNGSLSNPAPEGYYVDYSSTGFPVRQLHRAGVGFNESDFLAAVPQTTYVLEDMTATGLAGLLSAVEDDHGGVVQIPAGTIRLDRTIYVPGRIILQGAGVGLTFIDANGYTDIMLRSDSEQHIVLRDMTLHGASSSQGNWQFNYCDNVLVERVESRYAKGANGRFRYCQRYTVRYADLHHAQDYHGLGTKDYFPSDGVGNNADAIAQAGDPDPGALWGNNFAIYSVNAYDNGEYGIDSHGENGEICGINAAGNVWGLKSPDAISVLHHNILVDGGRYAGRVYKSNGVTGRDPVDNYWYDMVIRNTQYGLNVEDGAQCFAGYNTYSGNQARVTISGGSIYTCPGTTEAGFAGVTVSTAMCDYVTGLRGADAGGGTGTEQGSAPYPYSEVITAVTWDDSGNIQRIAAGSDTWPTTWADDDLLYTSGADGDPITESA